MSKSFGVLPVEIFSIIANYMPNSFVFMRLNKYFYKLYDSKFGYYICESKTFAYNYDLPKFHHVMTRLKVTNCMICDCDNISAKFPYLTYLDLIQRSKTIKGDRCYKSYSGYYNSLTDLTIEKLVHLRTLYIARSTKITDLGISKLQNLTYLKCYFCKNITEKSVYHLKTLKEIVFNQEEYHSESIISSLIRFEISEDNRYLREFLKTGALSKSLKSLKINHTKYMNIKIDLKNLYNLTSLDISFCFKAHDSIIRECYNLVSLKCNSCYYITDIGLTYLKKLIKLECSKTKITDKSILSLNDLIYLVCLDCQNITSTAIMKLIHLKYLDYNGHRDDEFRKFLSTIKWDYKIKNDI